MVELIAREAGVDPTRVLMDQEGTWILAGETKQPGREVRSDV